MAKGGSGGKSSSGTTPRTTYGPGSNIPSKGGKKGGGKMGGKGC